MIVKVPYTVWRQRWWSFPLVSLNLYLKWQLFVNKSYDSLLNVLTLYLEFFIRKYALIRLFPQIFAWVSSIEFFFLSFLWNASFAIYRIICRPSVELSTLLILKITWIIYTCIPIICLLFLVMVILTQFFLWLALESLVFVLSWNKPAYWCKK